MNSAQARAVETLITCAVSNPGFTRSGGAGGAFEVIPSDDGTTIRLRVTGENPEASFRQEAGGHRWQHIPDHDRAGRVHSSTVTVAVLMPQAASAVMIREADCDWTVCRSGGPGGQHVQKTASAVQVFHRPSGLRIRAEEFRDQRQNRVAALERLRDALSRRAVMQAHQQTNGLRASQIGSGERSDKVRTIRLQDDVVTDHRTGVKSTARRFLDGDLSALMM